MGRHLPAAAFAAILLVTSLLPVPESGGQTLPSLLGVTLDKWVHAGSYGLLTGLLAWGHGSRDSWVVAALVVLTAGYGAGIELLQGLVPSRGTSVADMVANAVGAALVGVLWLATARQLG